jgi:adenosylcobinamide-GDP ribazoletransferase
MCDDLEMPLKNETRVRDEPVSNSTFIRHPSSLLIGFLAALQFLTVVPPLIRRPFTARELGQSVGWFPLVGVVLGASLASADYTLSFLFPPNVTSALLLTMWVLATGALHLDGFLDSCDGLFGGKTTEQRLSIMRDERAGAFAVAGGILLLLVKYSCLAGLPSRWTALVVAPTLARWGMAVAVIAFPYARSEGLGRWMKDCAGWRQVAVASLTALVTATLAAWWLGLAALALAAAALVASAVFVLRRLSGLTGDIYGALCELLETLTLLTFVAGERL